MSDYSYELIKKGLNVAALRQKTISSNIANINTQNYKVNKVEFEEYLAKASEGIVLNKTHEKHISIRGLEDIVPEVKKRETTSLNENGNNVDIDLEMTELAANEIYYNILIQQLNSKLSSLNYVINKQFILSYRIYLYVISTGTKWNGEISSFESIEIRRSLGFARDDKTRNYYVMIYSMNRGEKNVSI